MKKYLSAQRRRSFALVVIAFAVLAFQVSPSASHRWRRYHWARTANPFNINLGDNLGSPWSTGGYLGTASTDWSTPTGGAPLVLFTTVVKPGAGLKDCGPVSGRVEVCNADYGNNNWLGVAQIWITAGQHIAQGTVKVNDYYFKTSKYNTSEWRQMVLCQEIGHTFGLDHQDTNFDNTNLGTCMDYTNDPGRDDGNGNNLHPNQHDYDELAIIYSHLDSFNTATGAKAPALNDPSEWGQLMKTAHGGKTQIFERAFGNGEIVVTFVIWA
jgi:hypothetical protein